MDDFFKTDHNLPSSDELEGLGCEQIEEEAEYDALNDETFGTEALEGDWEQDHEKLAQLTEKSRSTLSKLSLDDASDIEAEISQLVLESPEPEESSSFSINASVDSEVPITYSWMPPWQGSIQKPPLILLNQQAVTKNVQTVEELERNLLQQRECRDIHKNNNIKSLQQTGLPVIRTFFHHNSNSLVGSIAGSGNNSVIDHGDISNLHVQRPIYIQNSRFTPRENFSNYRNQNDFRRNFQSSNFFPNHQAYQENHHHHNLNYHHHHHQNQFFYNNQHRNQQAYRHGFNNRFENPDYDEYAGLMSSREKQWLINIQTMQISSDNPYVDDYYYMTLASKKPGWGKNRLSERKESQPIKTYIPTQFENSLGKLQVGSVTAPRKIIDMELIAKENLETISYLSTHESKKTKQYLLELEKLYSLLLKLEDFSSNILELKALVTENKQEIIVKIVNGLSTDDLMFTSFGIRKGKMFLLRFLPHLFENDTFKSDIIEIWTKMLRNFPIIQRRDINHQILPRFFPLFKEFISTKSSLKDIFQIVKIFIDKNLRNPLHSALVNSFGISAIIRIIIQVDEFNSKLEINQLLPDWQLFISSLVEACEEIDFDNFAQPLEVIPIDILTRQLAVKDSLQIHSFSKLEEIFSNGNSKNVHQ